MMKRTDVGLAIDKIIIPYFDCICWKDFSKDKAMFDISGHKDAADKEDIAETAESVLLEMERGSQRATKLGESLSKEFKVQYVTYPYMVKLVTRVLALSTIKEIEEMVQLSILFKNRIRQKGPGKLTAADRAEIFEQLKKAESLLK